MALTPTTMHDEVREYYAHLGGSDDLKTNAACCATDAPPKYVLDVMPLVPDEVVERFYGCGSPIPPALEGCTVLDLGCGTGRDVYVLSKLVGESGRVIGVDMTPEQLEVARKYQKSQAEKYGYAKSNVEFKLGYIEDLAALGIANESVDVVVSNCVVNLSPFKDLVFAEIYRVLKPGGELYFSDVYSDRRMPEALRHDPVLVGECLGGALYIEDFRRKLEACGWGNFVCTVIDPIHIGDLAVETKVGFMGFTSRTVRAIKCEGLESTEEDFGQCVTYVGGMPESPRYFDFSADVRFVKGKPRAVSGNTARMLAASRYGRFFDITPAGAHRGLFNAERAQLALEVRGGRRQVDGELLTRAYDRQGYVTFAERVGEPSLLCTRECQSTMQVNITYRCNLACRHCYLECGPKNDEFMSRETMQACLDAFSAGGFSTMDITGGSPELHPDFEWFLREAAARGNVIVRSNLTLLTKPEYAGLVQTFAQVGARVVGSLPFYNGDGTDTQRGRGVFLRCMEAVRALNAVGYGAGEGAGLNGNTLTLDLVYNVSGPFLPWPQNLLEDAYRVYLERDHGVCFDNLLAFNNYALGRFAHDLLDAGMLDDYLALLADNFNAMAVTRMMCLDQVNVDVDGRLYDCEVNHVLGLPIQVACDAEEEREASAECAAECASEAVSRDATIADLASGQLPPRTIRTSPVCYSCTAGFGSSCGGSLV